MFPWVLLSAFFGTQGLQQTFFGTGPTAPQSDFEPSLRRIRSLILAVWAMFAVFFRASLLMFTWLQIEMVMTAWAVFCQGAVFLEGGW